VPSGLQERGAAQFGAFWCAYDEQEDVLGQTIVCSPETPEETRVWSPDARAPGITEACCERRLYATLTLQ